MQTIVYRYLDIDDIEINETASPSQTFVIAQTEKDGVWERVEPCKNLNTQEGCQQWGQIKLNASKKIPRGYIYYSQNKNFTCGFLYVYSMYWSLAYFWLVNSPDAIVLLGLVRDENDELTNEMMTKLVTILYKLTDQKFKLSLCYIATI